MAKLPTAESFGARRVSSGAPRRPGIINPSTAAAPYRATIAAAGAGAQAGREIANIGFDMIERESTAAAKEGDARASEEIRKILYDPEAGYLTTQGSNALDQREATIERLNALKDSSLEGLSTPARRKLQDSLARRVEGALGLVDRHTTAERRTWLNGASDARIQSAYQDSLFNPEETKASLAIIATEIEGKAATEGWSQEQTTFELEKAKSKVYSDQIVSQIDKDPVAAMEYLKANEKNMSATDVINVRAKLEPAVKKYVGRAKGRQASLSGASQTYLDSIKAAESGGRTDAKNPLSSATGLYQFTKGTWFDVMQKHPELGLTPDGRTNPAQQELAIRAFTADNAKILKGSGISPTNGNLYAAHFLGAGSASVVLRAGEATKVSDLVAPSVITANPFLKGMTVSQFKAWANKKGGGTAIGYNEKAGGMAEIMKIADPDVRNSAIQEYNLQTNAKIAANEVEAAQLGVRVAKGEATQQELDTSLTDGKISASRWESLTEQRISRENQIIKDNAAVTKLLEKIDAGGSGNSFDGDDRKGVNLIDDNIVKSIEAAAVVDDIEAPNEIQRQITAARLAMIAQTGVAPTGLVSELRNGIAQRSPEALAQADAAMRASPNAFTGVEGGTAVESAVTEFRAYTRVGMSAEQATRLATMTKEERELTKGTDKEVNKELEKVDVDTINDGFASWFSLSDPEVPPQLQGAAMRDYETLYRTARRDGVEADAAHELAMERLAGAQNGLYGVSDYASGVFVEGQKSWLASGASLGATGSGEDSLGAENGVMRLPPEKFYPPVNGSHEYIGEDIQKSLKSIEDWDGSGWWLASDEAETDSAVRRNQRGETELPGYRLYYRNERGEINFRYWRMEPEQIAELKAPEKAGRKKASEAQRTSLQRHREVQAQRNGITLQPFDNSADTILQQFMEGG